MPVINTALTQDQSPFFRLPAEVRNVIYDLVFQECNSQTATEIDNPWHPDYTHAQMIDTALLQTCKQAFFETYTIPASKATLRFWVARSPKWGPILGDCFDSRNRVVGMLNVAYRES
jgi:hypothetical protein